MKLNDLFKKSINREINGVIKVDQNDAKSIQLELEEYVITREVQKHLRTFFESLNYSSDTPTDKIGVWISGFFGSGKSHFLKMLALLLENNDIDGKKPYEYFKDKLDDEFIIGEISKAVHRKNKVILFNIDSKSEADSKTKKDAIVNVLMKVFNNSLGYCGEIPWLAKLERELEEQGVYESFKKEFEQGSGSNWEKIRENYYFETDKIYSSLAKVKGITVDDAKVMFEGAEKTYSLSIEKFAEIIKKYVEKTNERVTFFIDEIGQYIGDNTDLMLNLQTVAEDLGTQLKGKAWLVVTSQEAVDQVTQVKGKDFSKIKGRFATQLTLTSDNTDTVIKKRLLEKKTDVEKDLANVYKSNESILKNIISFSADTSEMKFYRDEKDFIDVYPFIPFQFNLVQKVFEKIRLMGATGAHLSQGERSLLSAFQEALKQIESKEVGALVPFSTFYSSIEVFLTSGIRRTISYADTNSRLEKFDIEVLKILFMVKYLDVIKPNLENLKTLLIESIDEDKIALGDKIKESLERLEGENLIHKSGEDWIFLTDEEQDINKEIKAIQPDPIEIIDYLHEVIFADIYPNTKYRHSQRNKDFSFLKVIDNKNYGSQLGDITLHLFTPYADEYMQSREKITLVYSDATACIVLPNIHDYLEAIKEKLQIQKYINKTSSQSFTESLEKIRNDKVSEKTRLEQDIKVMVENAIIQSEIFVNGSQVDINKSNAKYLFDETLSELVKRTYTKLDYVTSPFTSETLERVLTANDVEVMDIFGKETNVEAINEIGKRIEQNHEINKKTLLSDLKKSFTSRPFGWSEMDISGIILVLLVKGLITIKYNGEVVGKNNRSIINLLTSNRESDKITLNIKEQLDRSRVQNISKFASAYFDTFDPTEDEDILVERLKSSFNNDLSNWKRYLNSYNTRSYPNKDLVIHIVENLQNILNEKDINQFFSVIEGYIQFTKENSEQIENLKNFFIGNQKEIFDYAYEKNNLYTKERIVEMLPELEDDLRKVVSILESDSPYSEIKDLNSHLSKIDEAYEKLLSNKKQEGIDKINKFVEDIKLSIPSEIKSSETQILYPLTSILSSIKEGKNWTEVNSNYSQISDNYEKALYTLNSIVKALKSSNEPQKQIKPVKIIELVRRDKGLETEKDVDDYVGELGIKLKEEIKKGNTIKLL